MATTLKTYYKKISLHYFVGCDDEAVRSEQILKMYLLLVQLDELILLETVKQMTVWATTMSVCCPNANKICSSIYECVIGIGKEACITII